MTLGPGGLHSYTKGELEVCSWLQRTAKKKKKKINSLKSGIKKKKEKKMMLRTWSHNSVLTAGLHLKSHNMCSVKISSQEFNVV